MTLRSVLTEDGIPEIKGAKGDILEPSDGLCLKSLIMLFLEQHPDKLKPLMGHVLFLDRIAYPYFDRKHRSQSIIESRDSKIQPLMFQSSEIDDLGQNVAMLVADLLTRNCFPSAIGQPDPLHRADLGAKALGAKINKLIGQSVRRVQTTPEKILFRDYRDGSL